MKYWYKDREFPEVKASNADVVAVIPHSKQLDRVIEEHNALLDGLMKALDLLAVAGPNPALTNSKDYYKELHALQDKFLDYSNEDEGEDEEDL